MKVRLEIVFLALLLGAVMFVIAIVGKMQDRIRSYESVIKEKNDEITYHKNQNGLLVARKSAAELAVEDIKNSYPEIYRALKRDLDISVRDLKAYIQSEISVTGTGDGSVVNNYFTTNKYDTVKYRTFSMSDGYLEMNADILDSGKAPYKYTYADTVKQAISTSRKWFLGREYLYGSATLSNPNAKVVGSTNVLIKDYKPRKWGVGIGAQYNLMTGKPSLGVGIQYNLISF